MTLSLSESQKETDDVLKGLTKRVFMTGLSTEVRTGIRDLTKDSKTPRDYPAPVTQQQVASSMRCNFPFSAVTTASLVLHTRQLPLFKSTTFLCNTPTLLYEIVGVGGLEKETKCWLYNDDKKNIGIVRGLVKKEMPKLLFVTKTTIGASWEARVDVNSDLF